MNSFMVAIQVLKECNFRSFCYWSSLKFRTKRWL